MVSPYTSIICALMWHACICAKNYVTPPVACVWEWGDYSACSVSCGGGFRTRHPVITQEPQFGGKPCPLHVDVNVTETSPCRKDPCTGIVISFLDKPFTQSISVLGAFQHNNCYLCCMCIVNITYNCVKRAIVTIESMPQGSLHRYSYFLS